MSSISRHEPGRASGRGHTHSMAFIGAALTFTLLGCGVDKVKFSSPQLELVVSKSELAVLEGEQVTFTVALSAPPTAPVQVTVRSSDDAKVAGAPQELEITPDAFDVPQTVTVTGHADRDFNNETATITVESESLEPATLTVSVIECPTLAAQDFWLMFNPNNTPTGRRDVHVAGSPGTTVSIAGASAMEIPANGILTVDTGLMRIPTPPALVSSPTSRSGSTPAMPASTRAQAPAITSKRCCFRSARGLVTSSFPSSRSRSYFVSSRRATPLWSRSTV